MTLLGLTFRSLFNRRYVVLLTILSIALSVALLLGVARLRREVHDGFARTVTGSDLLVGPRSSPISLLLYAVFHVGEPASGVSRDTYDAIAAKRGIAWTIPLSLGDSLHGFPVLGTDGNYWAHYRYGDEQPLRFQSGRPFAGDREAVLGAEVAAKLHAALGRDLVLSHGEGAVSFANHDGHPFRVVGILAATGTPIDRTVHIDLSGIVGMHEMPNPFMPQAMRAEMTRRARADAFSPYALTAFLVGLRSPDLVFVAARSINGYRSEPLTAAMPAVTLQSLWETVGVAERALLVISWAVLATGLVGMALVMLAGLEARRREMAILRSIGASPGHVFFLLITEAMLIVIAGMATGVLLLQILVLAFRARLATAYGIVVSPGLPTPDEWRLLATILAASFVAAGLPAIRAYRATLADGLMIRS